jgi:hypothetical protein
MSRRQALKRGAAALVGAGVVGLAGCAQQPAETDSDNNSSELSGMVGGAGGPVGEIDTDPAANDHGVNWLTQTREYGKGDDDRYAFEGWLPEGNFEGLSTDQGALRDDKFCIINAHKSDSSNLRLFWQAGYGLRDPSGRLLPGEVVYLPTEEMLNSESSFDTAHITVNCYDGGIGELKRCSVYLFDVDLEAARGHGMYLRASERSPAGLYWEYGLAPRTR